MSSNAGPISCANVASASGRTFSRTSRTVAWKCAGVPAICLVGVIVREGDVEILLLAGGESDQGLLEPGDHAAAADHKREALGAPSVERLAVAGSLERDDDPVLHPDRPVLDGAEAGVLIAQLFDHPLDLGVVDGLDVDAERVVGVVAQADVRPHGDGHPVRGPLPLLKPDPFGVRDGQARRGWPGRAPRPWCR